MTQLFKALFFTLICGAPFQLQGQVLKLGNGNNETRAAFIKILNKSTSAQDTKAAEIQLGYFAVCAVAKNEQNGIREWVQYHLWKGVAKIYLYDNGSNPPLIQYLQDFVHSGKVDYFHYVNNNELTNDFEFHKLYEDNKYFPNKRNRFQVMAYNQCLQQFGHRHKFVGIFDVDEFLVIENNTTQKFDEYLKQFEQFGGIRVFRRFFGSMGYQKRPPGGVLESYTECAPNPEAYAPAKNPKVIINMDYFAGLCTVHWCTTTIPQANTELVERTKDNVITKKFKKTFDGLVINHYFVKSYEEFEMKYLRKLPDEASVTKEYMEERTREILDVLNEAVKGTQCLEGIELYKLCCQNTTQV